MYRNNTPSAAPTIPIPVTKFDNTLDSPEPWPPSWRKVCKALFPGSPIVGQVLFPPARPYTGSLEPPSSPMSDFSSNCSPSSDACQVLAQPPMLRQVNVTFRVFYRPDELPETEYFSPSSTNRHSANENLMGSSRKTFAQAAEAISEASGLHLVGLGNASTFKDVVGALTEALREESLRSSGDSIDDVANKPSESIDGPTNDNDKTTIPNPGSFNLDARAFMSYGLLCNPGKKSTVQDNLESLAWIFIYAVLRYTKHNAIKDAIKPTKPPELRTPRTPVRTKNKPNLHALLTLLFCQNTMVEEEYGVGFAKLALFLTHRPLPQDFEVFDNIPVTLAIFSLIELFEEKYRFLERILPKKVRLLAREHDISYEEAEAQYKNTDSYKRRMEKIETMPQRMEAIFETCLSAEGWPEQDILVDGLVPSNFDRVGY